LVFFKNTYKRGISHVGIYIGGGQFIHAANAHKGVRTDSLSSSYYQAHFAGLRRVLPAEMRTAAALR
jgi:cell wall-associated NlpC family hydrolase